MSSRREGEINAEEGGWGDVENKKGIRNEGYRESEKEK